MRKREVLLIEKDPESLGNMLSLLASAGHTVRTASDVNEALDILTSFHPGLLVFEPESPSNSGMCLPDLLRLDPQTRDIQVLALAAPGESVSNTERYAAIVSTPIEPAAFLQLVENIELQELPIASRPKDVFSELRAQFVAEGQASTGSMASADPETAGLVHRWAGLGGSLGLPEITKQARALEFLIRSPGFDQEMAPWVKGISELNALFTKAGENV
jgi:CheY-like chemotaxis protein